MLTVSIVRVEFLEQISPNFTVTQILRYVKTVDVSTCAILVYEMPRRSMNTEQDASANSQDVMDILKTQLSISTKTSMKIF